MLTLCDNQLPRLQSLGTSTTRRGCSKSSMSLGTIPRIMRPLHISTALRLSIAVIGSGLSCSGVNWILEITDSLRRLSSSLKVRYVTGCSLHLSDLSLTSVPRVSMLTLSHTEPQLRQRSRVHRLQRRKESLLEPSQGQLLVVWSFSRSSSPVSSGLIEA